MQRLELVRVRLGLGLGLGLELANPHHLLPSLQGRGLPAHVTRGGAPLDGDTFASTGKHESHEHFLKVVRTTFRPLSRDIVDMC